MLMQSLYLKLRLSKNLEESSCLSFLSIEPAGTFDCTLVRFLRTESGPGLASLKPLCLQHPGDAERLHVEEQEVQATLCHPEPFSSDFCLPSLAPLEHCQNSL